MNRRMILRLVCLILRVEAVSLVPAVVLSLVFREWHAAFGLSVTVVLSALLSLLSLLAPADDKSIGAQEGFISVALCWIAVSAVGALPFLLSGAIPNYIDAFFETVSGFTTTGASILPNVEAMPKSLLYWRSFTHFLGGMGVLVFLLAVVPMGKGKNSLLHVMRAESTGPQVDKLVPKLQSSAKILYTIYVVLTLIEIVFLLAGGMPLFDSVCTAFGTAGTGGFGIKNDSLAGYSMYLQGVVTVFMALFGVNFSIFYLLLLRQFKSVAKNQELLLYLGIMLTSIVLITVNILPLYRGQGGFKAFHDAAFQVSSIMTTTGFSTVDFDLWPPLSKAILLVLMFVGGCAGSTGGGVKVARILLMFKASKRSVKRMLTPRSVSLVHVDGQRISEDVIFNTYSYIALHILTFAVSMLIVSIDEFSIETNVSAVMACLNNIGPGFDVVGPTRNFADFSPLSKIVLSFNMLAGRLELFPVLMLFLPKAWKR